MMGAGSLDSLLGDVVRKRARARWIRDGADGTLFSRKNIQKTMPTLHDSNDGHWQLVSLTFPVGLHDEVMAELESTHGFQKKNQFACSWQTLRDR